MTEKKVKYTQYFKMPGIEEVCPECYGKVIGTDDGLELMISFAPGMKSYTTNPLYNVGDFTYPNCMTLVAKPYHSDSWGKPITKEEYEAAYQVFKTEMDSIVLDGILR